MDLDDIFQTLRLVSDSKKQPDNEHLHKLKIRWNLHEIVPHCRNFFLFYKLLTHIFKFRSVGLSKDINLLLSALDFFNESFKDPVIFKGRSINSRRKCAH